LKLVSKNLSVTEEEKEEQSLDGSKEDNTSKKSKRKRKGKGKHYNIGGRSLLSYGDVGIQNVWSPKGL
jgi:hypothetical protein